MVSLKSEQPSCSEMLHPSMIIIMPSRHSSDIACTAAVLLCLYIYRQQYMSFRPGGLPLLGGVSVAFRYG